MEAWFRREFHTVPLGRDKQDFGPEAWRDPLYELLKEFSDLVLLSVIEPLAEALTAESDAWVRGSISPIKELHGEIARLESTGEDADRQRTLQAEYDRVVSQLPTLAPSRLKRDLVQRIGELEDWAQKLPQVQRESLGIGHNNPLVGQDDHSTVLRALRDMRLQVRSSAPDRSVVFSAATVLSGFALRLGKWLGRQMQLAADEASKEFGKELGKQAGRHFAKITSAGAVGLAAYAAFGHDRLVSLLGKISRWAMWLL